MNSTQKNYLKKWAIVLGCFLIVGLLITCIVLGEPWDWIALGVTVAVIGVYIVGIAIEIIGSTIWIT